MGAGAAAGAAAVYRHDPGQLAFDAASAAGPALRLLDAEAAHDLAIRLADSPLARLAFPREARPDPPALATEVWGRAFANPIGLAAGFDKDARAAGALLATGFGFVEVGSITPLPQPGNARPRAFRLAELGAIINRYGFNSRGVDAAEGRLAALRARQRALLAPAESASGTKPALSTPDARVAHGVVGVNLGKNKLSDDAAADYALGAERLTAYADYLVVNVSSPNTPGLRALQGRAELEALLGAARRARDRAAAAAGAPPPPLLVKIAPDLTDADKADIAAVALRAGVDGLVVSNTTVARPPAVAAHARGGEAGGLSGAPLMEPSTEVLRDMYRLTGGRIPIVGVGGVASGADAYAKIRAGASLVQLYSAYALQGPALLPRIKRELSACLAADGFASVSEAVGADHRAPGAPAHGGTRRGWW